VKKIPRGKRRKQLPEALLTLTETDLAVFFYLIVEGLLVGRSTTVEVILGMKPTSTVAPRMLSKYGIPAGTIRPSLRKLTERGLVEEQGGRYKSNVQLLDVLEAYMRKRNEPR
jgi:hypothetical protein